MYLNKHTDFYNAEFKIYGKNIMLSLINNKY